MFYSQFILAKKGPLGTIWIAAHLERKLRKNQVADTDIGVSVDSIIFPEAPIALRLSSHLLLGVVRIYSRKVGYLFDDCSEALLKVKQAFRSTAVDLPPEESKAPYHSITLPETFELDDFELPDNEIIQGNYVDHHISSRDQITLQDTMEGVVYSTSKFGLDERFGDGDTSGLDLEDELFLDEVAAAGEASVSADPNASVEPMTPLKQDENREGMAANSESMIDGTDGDADLMDQDHDHAPCTPGLAEEPNLSNIQETSACEDQLGLEDRHLVEYAAKGNSENPPFENNVNNGSGLLENQAQTGSSDADTLHYVARDENGYHLSKQLEPDGQLSPSGVAFDPVDPALAPETLSAAVHEVAKSSSAVECEEEIVAASDGQANWWNLQCGVSGMDKGGISTPTGLHAEPLLPYGICSTKVDHDVSALSSICQQVPEDISLSNQRSLEAVSNNVEIPGNLEAGEFRDISCLETPKISLTNQTSPETLSNNAEIPGNLEAGESLDITCLETPKIAVTNQRSAEAVSINVVIPGSMGIGESQGITCLETLKADDCGKQSGFAEDGIGAQVPFLSRCNAAQIDASKSKWDHIDNHEPPSNFSGFHPPEISREEASHGLGETCPATGDSEQISKKNLVEEPVPRGDIRKDSDKSNYQVDNMVLEDRQMENMSGSAVSAFSAPEKFLSMSGGFVNLPQSIFPEATPGYLVGINGTDAGITTPGYLVGINGADAGSKFMSGRKRSYTESTLTEQSFNSAESSRMVRFRKTTGVIPDDDDLLSSILVGRKSSALKLKPTPPPSEITSSKRPRSAARMTASKRRVLMDDTMVLHGDMIRQQLIDAEDIRRMRKKAPCTHAEISAIQKQLLEDAIFREAVLTGLSVELASLHKQKFDLSGVRVSLTEVSCSQSEVVVDPQLTPEYAKNPILNLDEQRTMRFNEQHAERDSVMGGNNERYVGRDSSIKLGGVDATVPTENREVDDHDQHLSSINLDEQHTMRFNEQHVERENVMGGNNELYVGRDGSIKLGGVNATVPTENREVDNHEQLLSSNAYEPRPDTVAEVAAASGFHLQPSNNAAEVQPQGTCLSGAEVAAEATDIAAATEATDIASTGEVLLSCPNSGRLGGAIAGLLLSNSFDDSRREDTSILAEVSCGSPSHGLTAQADKAPENLNNKSLSPAGLLLTNSFDDSRREDTSILAEVSCGSPSHGLSAQGDMAPENLNNKSLSPNCGLNAQVDKALENLNSENLVDDSYWPENNYYFTTEAEAGTESRVADAVVYDAAQDSASIEATATIVENIVPGNDNQNFADKGTGTEQSNNAGASNEEMSVHTLDHSIGAGEYPCQQEDFSYNMTGAHFSDANMVDLNDLDYSAAENDTGFLNFDDDDDEEAEAADDYVPDADVTHINENSGWSSRTRAVSKYLQTLFVKESERGRKSLSMDSLLVGKTRKEASRMFFETLVLKTRDYIHVEQVIPFDDVTIKPRTKLLKSNF